AALDFSLVELHVGKFESGIAEAVAERIEWRALFIPIALALSFRSLGGVVRVVDGNLPGVAWPSHREFAARNSVAEKKIGDCGTTLRAGIPGFKNRLNMLRCPRQVERSAIE